MGTMIAIAYPDDREAVRVMETIKQLDATDSLDVDHPVAVSKNHEGRLQSHGRRRRWGLFLGTILGLIFIDLYGASGSCPLRHGCRRPDRQAR